MMGMGLPCGEAGKFGMYGQKPHSGVIRDDEYFLPGKALATRFAPVGGDGVRPRC